MIGMTSDPVGRNVTRRSEEAQTEAPTPTAGSTGGGADGEDDAAVAAKQEELIRFRPRALPLYRFHHFPAVYLLFTVLIYYWIQSEVGEQLHNYLLTMPVIGGGFTALIGFGTLLFVMSWHSYGALQALMDAYPNPLWSKWKIARLDNLTYFDILPNVLFNQVIVTAILLTALYQFSWAFLGGRGYDVTYKRLDPFTLTAHVLLNYLVYEVCFYFGHRFLHSSPALYRHHKLHHLTYGTVGVSGTYMSSFDYILTQGLPIILPPVVMGTHYSAMWFPLFIGGLNSIHSHGAYAFPGMPSPGDHLTHHLQQNRWFGTGLCDWLFGTD